MKSRRILLLCCVCIGACVVLHAAPVHAAVESAGLLDRATRLFENSLTKWGNTTKTAATALFWMLATLAFCWELGGLALRGGSMDAALAYLMRFAVIEGVWLYILQNAVPIGTAIIDSLRQLGSTASGLPKDLMPSAILDVGFSVLWKTIAFVSKNGLSAPIVSFCALIMALLILLAFALTAINMLVLIISQWFLLYGGIFFLGFGGAPWESDKARNYLYLALSIGAQLFGMAGVVGVGQSFIQEQYKQLSGDTTLGELAVILIVAMMICLLANEIPKLFARFVPGGYASQGLGYATLLGATASAAAAFGAAAVMAKGAMESMAGAIKAANAAYSAAKLQAQSPSVGRSQTGVRSGGGGSIGPAGGDGAERASLRTQGPLGAMLSSSGIGNSRGASGANGAPSARAGTHTPSTKPAADLSKPAADSPKPPASQSPAQGTEENSAAARAHAPQTPPAGAESNPAAQEASASKQSPSSPRASTHADEQLPSNEREGLENDVEETRAETSEADSVSAEQSTSESDESVEDADLEAPQNANTGSECSTGEDDGTAPSDARAETMTSADEPATTPNELTSSAAVNDGTDTSSASSTSQSAAASTESAASTTNLDTGASVTHCAAAAEMHSTGTPSSSSAASPLSTAGAADTSAAHTGAVTLAGAASTTPAPTGGAPTATNASEDDDSTAAATSPASSPAAQASDSGWSPPPTAAPMADPSGSATESGGQHGSTSIGTVLQAAKILGGHAVEHQRGRIREAKDAFLARADQTVGGQIAQAIRNTYGLDKPSSDPRTDAGSTVPLRSHTGASKPAPLHAAGSKNPADWITGDDPMTDNQQFFLQRRLGDDVDPHMTKAEASILIEELLNDED